MRTSLQHETVGLAVVWCLFALLICPVSARAAVWYDGEFSADIIITMPHAPDNAVRGSLNVGKDRFRSEGLHQGKPAAMVVHPQERMVWMLFPTEKTYYTGPGDLLVPPRPDVERLPGDSDGPCQQDKTIVCTRLGTETLHGLETEKWAILIPPPSPPAAADQAARQSAQKVTVWADSSGGPEMMLVAKWMLVCRPVSPMTLRLATGKVKDGA